MDFAVPLFAFPGELQSQAEEEKFCHRDQRGHRETLVFNTLCPLWSLWLILELFGFATLQFSCLRGNR